MDPADIHARALPTPVWGVVITQAEHFYYGRVSSIEAYTAIDKAALSPWNYFSGIIDRTREEFERHIDRLMDAEIEGWTRDAD